MLRQPLVSLSIAAVLWAPPLLSRQAWAADHVAPPAGDAANYPAVDIHPEEHVAIAADPYDTKDKMEVFRFDYLQYGFIPIRIIVTNNSDHAISLADARIDFITSAGDKIPSAEVPDIQRRIDRVKRPKTITPLPHIGKSSGKENDTIQADFDSFEYAFPAVEAHTTRSGFLFYDLEGIANPLQGGKLSLTTVRDANGKELFYFEIPFQKYLAAQAGPRSAN